MGREPALNHLLLGKEMVRINWVGFCSTMREFSPLQSCLLSSIYGGGYPPSTELKERHSQSLQNEDGEKSLIFIFRIADGDLRVESHKLEVGRIREDVLGRGVLWTELPEHSVLEIGLV